MLKNMIGGNFDYLQTYVPQKVEFNYRIIDNGFDFDLYNQHTRSEDTISFYNYQINYFDKWIEKL